MLGDYAFVELMTRPAKNTQEIGSPDINRVKAIPPIEAAPIADVRTLGPQVSRAAADDEAVIFRD
jgi:hypothetical protein